MPQMMLAILALMVAGMFVMQQHQRVAASHIQFVRNEIAMQGTGVAEELLGEVNDMAFDEHTKDEEDVVLQPSGLTEGPPFVDDSQSNDIDDFHSYEGTRMRPIGNDTLRYQVSVAVVYADETQMDTRVTGPTKVKMATVKVHSLDIVRPDTVRVSRSYTCGSKCAW